jgi:hypothetical protein
MVQRVPDSYTFQYSIEHLQFSIGWYNHLLQLYGLVLLQHHGFHARYRLIERHIWSERRGVLGVSKQHLKFNHGNPQQLHGYLQWIGIGRDRFHRKREFAHARV